jgi:hydroxyethylthiazole kinase-like sugar kinase family protein
MIRTLDLTGMGATARGLTIQIYTAGNGAYDYAKAAISLERSNSFPWIKDCVQIHQTLFPPRGWDLGTRL